MRSIRFICCGGEEGDFSNDQEGEYPCEPTAQMVLVEGMETFGVQCAFANTLRKFVDLRFPM